MTRSFTKSGAKKLTFKGVAVSFWSDDRKLLHLGALEREAFLPLFVKE
jgi:hypothetical protein